MGLPEGRVFEQALFLHLNIALERGGVNRENIHVNENVQNMTIYIVMEYLRVGDAS